MKGWRKWVRKNTKLTPRGGECRSMPHTQDMKRQRGEKRGWELEEARKRGMQEPEREDWDFFFFLYLQNLQIAQRSESSIFDAADVVAVQLPAPSTQTRTQAHTHAHKRERWESQAQVGKICSAGGGTNKRQVPWMRVCMWGCVRWFPNKWA